MRIMVHKIDNAAAIDGSICSKEPKATPIEVQSITLLVCSLTASILSIISLNI